MASMKLGLGLLNELADAGLPIPLNTTSIKLTAEVDGVAVLTVTSILTAEDSSKITKVLREHRYQLIKDDG